MKKLIILFLFVYALSSCSENGKSDAYGTFEATEITISSEAAGKIMTLPIEEGQSLDRDEPAGLIDTIDYYLKMEQLKAQKKAIASKYENIKAQVDVQIQQKKNLQFDYNRVEKLRKDDAVPQKQLDDIVMNLTLIDKQIAYTQTQNINVTSEISGIEKQIDQVNESIKKCKIINPVGGTVIGKYLQAGEYTIPGKPIYKIADMDSMYLRVYVSGKQLPGLKTGCNADVITDKTLVTGKLLTGTITWISPNAEFTPKVIQTRDERVNLVYAVKILVKNDGSLQIGMPGEVNFRDCSR